MMLDQLIRQTAVAQEGAKSMTARDTAALELERRAYLSSAALERAASAEPTEDELHAVYDKVFGADAAETTEYHAAHILVDTEEAAKAIADEIAAGADFAKLAEERSTDNSGPNKGDLGWFKPEQMVKPFADAVVALKKGEVSAPVQIAIRLARHQADRPAQGRAAQVRRGARPAGDAGAPRQGQRRDRAPDRAPPRSKRRPTWTLRC